MNPRVLGHLLLALFPMFMFLNCSDKTSPPASYSDGFPFSRSAQYFSASTSVELEVHYESGAEPFVGNTTNGRPYWGITQENIEAIMQFRSVAPTYAVPKTLAEMHPMPMLGKADWTAADLMALHAQYKLSSPSPAAARFYVFFLKGNFNEAGVRKTGVIGVNIGGTPVVAIFKEVIQNNVTFPNGPAAKFVEQSTVVHELGHALGFVDFGVPAQTAHADGAHPGHTVNSNCVMYWLNEGVSDLQAFVQQYLASSSVVMWGPEVLQDAQALSR